MINAACEYNLGLHIHGGGLSAQAFAASQVIARCIVKRNPIYKPLFKKCKEQKLKMI
jgi:ribosomal protein S9